MKRIIIVFLIATLFLCFSGCFGGDEEYVFVYSGDNPDLYTEAIHSILGANGYYRIPELGYKGNSDPLIEVVEQDAYGRKLFLYSEHDQTSYLLISQKTENNIVYYYPDYNLIEAKFDTTQPQDETTEENDYLYYYWKTGSRFRVRLSTLQVSELKTINDWGQEFNTDKCIRQNVTNQKDDPLTNKEKNALYKEIFGESSSSNYYAFRYMTKDDEGKLLYLAIGHSDDFRMVIVDDKTQHNRKTNDLTSYQQELANFKQENNWKKS